jgi:hypothetical protein
VQEPTSNRDQRGLATRAVVLTVGSLCLLRVGRDFFLPLITAGFLVYLVEVLSRLIQRLRIRGCRLPNALCTAFAFGLIFGLGYAFSLVVIDNALQISAAAPRYQIRLQQVISQGLAALGLERQPELKDLVRAVDLRAAFGIATRTVSRTLSNATLVLLYGLFIVLKLRCLCAGSAWKGPPSGPCWSSCSILSRLWARSSPPSFPPPSACALHGAHYPSPERMAELSGALLKIAFAAISPAWFLGVGCLGRLVGVRQVQG